MANSIKSLKIFLFFLLLTNSTYSQKISKPFTGQLKRDDSNTKISDIIFKFNPTLKTQKNPPIINSNERIIDNNDVRLFPSANPQAEVHM